MQLERTLCKETKRQQVATKATANKTIAIKIEANKAAHEVAMVAHLGQHAIAAALATGATNEEAIASGMAASATTWGARDARTCRIAYLRKTHN